MVPSKCGMIDLWDDGGAGRSGTDEKYNFIHALRFSLFRYILDDSNTNSRRAVRAAAAR